MINYKFFCLLLIAPFSLKSQPIGFEYHKIDFKLDSLLTIAFDTTEYLNYFESLNDSLLLEKDIFMAARVYANKKNYKKFESQSKRSFQLGQQTSTFFNMIYPLPDIQIKNLINDELEGKKIYFQHVPYTLHDEIKEMALIDAHLRNLNFSGTIPYKIIRNNDSLNLLRIKFLVNKYGFLNERDFGALFNSFFYLLLHVSYSNLEDYQWVKKLFLKSVMAGSCDANLYAYFVDRWEFLTTKTLYYGSFNNKTPIQDIKNVDARRKAIGACTLENWRKLRKGKF